MDDNRVIVDGLPPTCSSVKLKLKFEKCCDVKISNLKIAAEQAEVIFDNPEDAEKFCKNIPPQITFGNASFNISARKASHDINGTQDSASSVNLDRKCSWYDLKELPKCKKGLLVQSKKKLSWPSVKSYFENRALSMGGRIAEGINLMDGLLVIFKDELTVDRVWDFRPHRVGDIPIVVHMKYIPAIREGTLVIEGTQDYTTENARSDLALCLSKKGDEILESVKSYESVILARFSKSIDEKCIEDIFQEFKKVAGDKIQIKRLTRTDCIKVSNLPRSITEIEITSLFENPSRTRGGPVTLVERIDETSALVYFSSSVDAIAVRDKIQCDGLDVFSHPIKASFYHHGIHSFLTTERKLGTTDASSSKKDIDGSATIVFTYDDVTTDLLKYFSERRGKLDLFQQRVRPATIQIKRKLQITLARGGLDQPMTVEDVENKVKTFLEEYVSKKYEDFSEKDVGKIREQMLDYRFQVDYRGDRDCDVRWSGEKKVTLVCVGSKDKVKSLLASMKETVNPAGYRMVLQEKQFKWYTNFHGPEKSRQKKGVKITPNAAQLALIFSGNAPEIPWAQQDIVKTLQQLITDGYIPKTDGIRLFITQSSVSKDVTDYINARLNQSEVILIGEEVGFILFGSPGNTRDAKAKLNELLVEEHCDIPTDIRQDRRVKKAAQSEFICLINEEDTVKIIGLREHVESLKECVERAKKTPKESRSTTPLPFVMPLPLVKIDYMLHRHTEFRSMLTKYSVTAEKSDTAIALRGQDNDIHTVSSMLPTWISKLKERTKLINQQGAMTYFMSEAGKRALGAIADTYSTSIIATRSSCAGMEVQSGRMSSATSDTASGDVLSMAQIKSMNVCVKTGDITKEKTDAIVNLTDSTFNLSTAGSLSKAVLEKGGKCVQKELNKAKGTFARVTRGGDLSCKHIIHILAPGNLNQIVEQVKRVLKRANDLKCESISFPVTISPGGAMSVRDQEIAQAMLEAICEFASENERILTQIFLVIRDDFRVNDFCSVISQHSDTPLGAARNPSPPSQQDRTHFSIDYGNMKVSIKQADITRDRNDAIVNSTGTTFDLRNGMVSKAIIKMGGDSIQYELKGKQGGKIRITSAGNLHCRHIIHVVFPASSEELGPLVLDILKVAEQNQFRSLSIPALGTGKMKMRPADVGTIFAQAFSEYSSKFPSNKYLKTVDIVIYETAHLVPFCSGFTTRTEASSDFGSSVLRTVGRYLPLPNAWKPIDTTYSVQTKHLSPDLQETSVDGARITLQFCSTSVENIDKADRAIRVAMDLALKTKSMPDGRLLLLQPREREQLKTFGNRIGVSVIISGEATLTVSGTKEGVDEVLKEFERLLATVQNQSLPAGGSTYPASTYPRSTYPH